jgi:hypothetical protein
MKEQEKSSAILRGKVQLEAFPLEVVQLLKVLARIEMRRQAKLRDSERMVVHASTEVSS